MSFNLNGVWKHVETDLTTHLWNGAAMVAFQEKLYFLKGITEKGTSWTGSKQFYCYDPTTNTWEEKASCNTARGYGTMLVHQNKIYVFGGCCESTVDSVEVYDHVADAWSEVSKLPVDMHGVVAASLNDNIFLCSGLHKQNRTVLFPKKTFMFDPNNNTWEEKEEFPEERSSHSASLVHRNNKLYYFGGIYGGHLVIPVETRRNIYEYDLDNDKWAMVGAVPDDITAPNFIQYGDSVIVICPGTGKSYIYSFNENEWCSFTDVIAEPTHMNLEIVNDVLYVVGGAPGSVSFLYYDLKNLDNEYIITESYQLLDGTPLQPDTQTVVEAGDNYQKAAPRINGYKRVGHTVDGANLTTSSIATIRNVSSNHHVVFLYEIGDEDDNGGGNGNGNCCCYGCGSSCCTKVEVRIQTCSSNQSLLNDINDALQRDEFTTSHCKRI